jgi:hypothetical protein
MSTREGERRRKREREYYEIENEQRDHILTCELRLSYKNHIDRSIDLRDPLCLLVGVRRDNGKALFVLNELKDVLVVRRVGKRKHLIRKEKDG